MTSVDRQTSRSFESGGERQNPGNTRNTSPLKPPHKANCSDRVYCIDYWFSITPNDIVHGCRGLRCAVFTYTSTIAIISDPVLTSRSQTRPQLSLTAVAHHAEWRVQSRRAVCKYRKHAAILGASVCALLGDESFAVLCQVCKRQRYMRSPSSRAFVLYGQWVWHVIRSRRVSRWG